MGNRSSPAVHDKQIDLSLRHSQKNDIKKILLLGSGGSGKSTLFRQLQYIHGTGFTENERKVFIDHICAQIIGQMKHVLDCIEDAAEEDGNLNPFKNFSDEATNAANRLRATSSNPYVCKPIHYSHCTLHEDKYKRYRLVDQ